MKNLNFVAGMTRRFVSAKRLIRYFSNSSKLVEHRAQSPVREVKMLAVWPSITEGFPTASSRVIYNKNCQVLMKNLNFVAGMTRRFVSAKRLIRYFSNSHVCPIIDSGTFTLKINNLHARLSAEEDDFLYNVICITFV